MTPETEQQRLLREIERRHAELSPRLQQAARHLVEHPNEAALHTVTALAEAAGVQPSVLVRLAKAFGYSGFSDMQKVFQAALAAAAPSYGERLRALRRSSPAGPAELLRQACALNQLSLQALADGVDGAALERAVALLAAATLVHVAGQRRSHPVAAYVAYGLTRSGRSARLLSGAGGTFRDEVETMRPGEALVVVSQHPYSAEAVDAAAWAASHGVGVVAITDGPLSPLARHATVALEVRDAELVGFRAIVAQICLAQVLVLGVLGARTEAPGVPGVPA